MIVRLRVGFRTRRSTRARFHSPVEGTPRTAILMPGFEQSSSVRVFAEGSYDEVAGFRPELLAAPAVELRRIGRLVMAGRLDLPSLEVGLVAFLRAGAPPLSPSDRDVLWSAFGLPLYEQLLGPDLEALAAECGAHAGLHLLPGAGRLGVNVRHGILRAVPPGRTPLDFGLHARLAMDRCACGQTTPRLTGLGAAHPAPLRAAAAVAAD